MEALRVHVASGDHKAVQHQAHTIKGAAAALGGEGLVKLAFALERSGNTGDLLAERSCFEALVSEFERLKQAIEASSLLSASKA
jgi:HPt (histidine-containing phosphotransfer) domain-containing protein